MKYSYLFLLLTLLTPSLYSITSAEIKNLNQEKKSFTAHMKEFIKCVKGDKNCDPQKTKTYRTGLGIIGALLIAGITTGIYWPKKPVININEALIQAAEQRNLPEVERIVTLKEIDLNYRGKIAETPLTSAAERGQTAIVKVLLDAGADINKTGIAQSALFVAAERGYEDTVNLLLERGAKTDPKSTGRVRASGGTILHATYKPAIIAALIKHGADVNEINYKGVTPLMGAAQDGNLEKIKVLIHHGAKIDAQDDKKETALDKARAALQDVRPWEGQEKKSKYEHTVKFLEEQNK